VAAGILNEQLQQEHSCSWVEDGSKMATEITFQLKALLGLGLIVGLGGLSLIVYKLHQLLRAIQDLHSDIGVIRLDNSRTMAELRRRHR